MLLSGPRHILIRGREQRFTHLCVGHEIVGKAVRVGDRVTSVKVGDIVGVGPNVWSCGECSACKKDLERYCVSWVRT